MTQIGKMKPFKYVSIEQHISVQRCTSNYSSEAFSVNSTEMSDTNTQEWNEMVLEYLMPTPQLFFDTSMLYARPQGKGSVIYLYTIIYWVEFDIIILRANPIFKV